MRATPGLTAIFCAIAIATAWPARTEEPAARNPFERGPTQLTYDSEYPAVGYAATPTQNAVARLQARLERGESKLEFHPPRGYLDSLLRVLNIDPSSQTLVYSRTSLQTGSIRAATPRAIYFNDETYVAWVQGSREIELGTTDASLGQVFYTLENHAGAETRFKRETVRCLSCHDTYSLSGGGVPRFLLMSSYVGRNGEQLTHEGSILTTDRTQLRYRWGGWYVTGRHGDQVHLGNILVNRVDELVNLESVRRGNLETLDALFDTGPYLTNKSDIVALLVLQHQVHVQNLMTRVNFEVRQWLARAGSAPGPNGAVPNPPAEVREHLDALLDAMLFVEAAPFTSPISGNAGFEAWFQAQGPRDRRGRSLRDLELSTRLFRYPLSFLVYSEGFAALPEQARQYLLVRLAAILGGRGADERYAHLLPADREALAEILTATLPAFAQVGGAPGHSGSATSLRAPGPG